MTGEAHRLKWAAGVACDSGKREWEIFARVKILMDAEECRNLLRNSCKEEWKKKGCSHTKALS
ncbi:hypothetical protein SAMN05216411_11522 [Nitrosospira multiformis]|nr:hypothetical protein SAMN05216411_11522 [Nitrosospira multiformis]